MDSRAGLDAAVRVHRDAGCAEDAHIGLRRQGPVRTAGAADLDAAWAALGNAPLLYENLVPFDKEVSIIAVRGQDGAIAFYPLNLNVHREGILRLTRAPFINAALTRQAQRAARRLLEHFNYVGVLTIEFFASRGRLIANEMAPRVHNSGHWTIEGAQTSQFENHVRAIAGLPLGSTAATRPCGHDQSSGRVARARRPAGTARPALA